jgi:protein-ribulosamine 3-kinase
VNPQGEVAQALARAISDAREAHFEPTAIEGVSGGCIHTAVKISGGMGGAAHDFFAKVNDADSDAMFAAEAEGLAALRAAGVLTVPAVITRGEDGERSWLVLEWLELAPLEEKSAALLGTALAALHRKPQEKFGWAHDNFIGASPQANGWSDDWLAFWREKRLVAQLRMAARKRLPSKMIDRGERLATDCHEFFRTHKPARSLLHGDLWGGNVAATRDAGPAVFDPAVYVGDREADVAMTELFGGFPKDFRAAYVAAWALDDGYAVRRNLYNLYHVLNHANIFAGNYVAQAADSIERLLAEIR